MVSPANSTYSRSRLLPIPQRKPLRHSAGNSVQMSIGLWTPLPTSSTIHHRCPQLIMSRDVPSLKGPYHPYAKQQLDWRAEFEALSVGSPRRTVRDVAAEWGLPYSTVTRRWRNYQRAVKERDDTALAVACGDVDGRRDNHRIFSREEEALLRAAIDQENAHPNTPSIQRLALSIHSAHQSTHSPAMNTRSHPHADPIFHASADFVERINREFNLSPQKPRIQRRYVKKRGAEWEEERQSQAIAFEDEVHRSVLRNGADMVIHSDEISCKSSPLLSLSSRPREAITLPSSNPIRPPRRPSL